MRRRRRSDEGASLDPLLPGNPREPGLQKVAVKATRTTGQVNASYTAFLHLILKKMFIDENDIRKIIAEVQATSWRLRECIRVRELTATHRLGQMRRLRMLEDQKAWKREAGFDHIDTAAEMDAQRFRTNLVSESFYSKMFNTRWFYTPDELTLEMRIDVERLRIGINCPFTDAADAM